MALLSIVLPLYNEEQNIVHTAQILSELLMQEQIEYELIFVSNGFRDGTYQEILKAAGQNPYIKGAEFSPGSFLDNVNNADLVFSIVEEKYPQLKPIAIRFGLYQRLDYLLHIPIGQMRRDNGQYRAIVWFLRSHVGDTVRSPYLTGKNKLYLLSLTTAPRTVRRLHRLGMRIRKRCP